MFANIDIFKMSAAMASHAGRRQSLTAQNMANVDTPGFKAQRLQSFSNLLTDTGTDSTLRATRSQHLDGAGAEVIHARGETVKNDPALDGNTVTVEGEMLESIGARREHDRALAIYKSALNILHTTLARS